MQKLDGSDQLNKLEEVGAWLRRRLPDLLVESQVPGAAVAVQAGDEWVESAAGVLSTATGVDATVDSLFQIGSITKVMTATLVMQLADEGRLDLDAPVRAVLPEFRIADEEAARGITTRHLLSHVAGFEGDIFTDTGKGDDCLEKYLGVLRDVPQLFEPGAMFSYNNAGYCVLGRIVEVLREEPLHLGQRRDPGAGQPAARRAAHRPGRAAGTVQPQPPSGVPAHRGLGGAGRVGTDVPGRLRNGSAHVRHRRGGQTDPGEFTEDPARDLRVHAP
ncbi:serine hydrolase domain-containing protein [Streptomyces sp. NPDC002012]|uniref:serine hydrolase domain-containing protein n=1 Tax=Streptomyces sp. NPDC002012 TaxID=3154532 RepID=UPI0033201737